jgi:hypothetical protein
MICLRTEAIRTEWVQRVRDSLRANGFYYEPEFCSETDDAQPVVTAANLLGHLYIPPDTEPNQPVILTQPSPSAPQWRPFDRRAAIGWHNDFSTRSRRPELSLSWIRKEDPAGPKGGAWRVASAAAVLVKLFQTREGKRLVADLSTQAVPFGYRDMGGWHPFRVIISADRRLGRRGLRFYGRALEEGAWLRFGHIPERTHEIIVRLEEAADAVGEVLCASRGALLIVDNRLSLHDRTEQQVTGPDERRRQAWLCFVKQLHQPL